MEHVIVTLQETASDAPVKAGALADSPEFDGQLEAVRRIDWRFLLPEPALERVGFVGPAGSTLSRALAMFSRELILLERDQVTETALGLDMLVSETTDLARIAVATFHIKPGGFLYAEWHGKYPFQSHASFLAGLTGLGYNSQVLHWHRPDFELCRDLIPLQERSALKHVFSRNISGAKGLASWMVGGLLISTGLIQRAVGCVSIVAQKEAGA